jgi:hypothetical protein
MSFSQVDIKAADWAQFKEFIVNSRNDIFVTAEEKAFCERYVFVTTDDGDCVQEKTKLWMKILRDKITEALDLSVCFRRCYYIRI